MKLVHVCRMPEFLQAFGAVAANRKQIEGKEQAASCLMVCSGHPFRDPFFNLRFACKRRSGTDQRIRRRRPIITVSDKAWEV